LTSQDLDDYGYDSHTIMDVNGTDTAVQFANGTEVLNPELQQLSGDDLLPDVTSNTSHISSTPANSRPSSLNANSTSAITAATNVSDVRPWNISAVDVDDSRKRRRGTNVTEHMLIVHPSTVTTYKFETQQEPNGDAIDIIALSEMYILGQIESSGATNATTSHAHRRALHHHHHEIHHGHKHATQHSRRAVEGPIQCGPDQPCKDGACCNKDGKWLVSTIPTLAQRFWSY
jgi:hypothetical protein